MEAWGWTTLLLCLYGFLKDFKPSEPFLTQYLIAPNYVNITLQDAYQSVYPVWTYSYLAVLVLVFLVTDWARYKPVIVFEGLAYVATWVLLVFGSGVPQMQLMQFTYGIATSTEVAYYTYIYSKVDPKHFQLVTSFTRVAILLGFFMSSVTGQILTSFEVVDFRQLNIISLCSVILATLVACCLPSVTSSIYFHNNVDDNEHNVALDSRPAFEKLKGNFVDSFGQESVFRWSLWWALGMAGNLSVGNFIQPLWETLHPRAHEGDLYNGAVEAASTLAGAILAFAFAYVKLNWALVGEPLLVVISVVDGIVLIAMGWADNIWLAYVGYLLYRSLFQMLITVASFEVARQIKADSYGLVFGVNTFLALLFQTLLTLVVVEWLALNPKDQFVVYGGYSIAIGAIFLLIFAFRLCRRGCDSYSEQVQKEGIWRSYDHANDDCESRQLSLGGALEAAK